MVKVLGMRSPLATARQTPPPPLRWWLLALNMMWVGIYGIASSNAYGINSPEEVRSWYQEVKDKLPRLNFPRSIIFTKDGNDEQPGIIEVRPPYAAYENIFKVRGKDYIEAFKSVNHFTEALKEGGSSSSQWQQAFLRRYKIDAMIDTSESPWELFYVFRDQAETFKYLGRKKLTGRALVQGIMKTLGYTGVILDKRDDLILVAEFKFFKTGSQAFLVEDSYKKSRITSKAEDAAIVEKRISADNLGVYEVLVGSAQIEPGTKIIHASFQKSIQKKKSKGRDSPKK